MSYKIVRFYQNPSVPQETIERGLTLAEAQDHCRDPETNSRTCVMPHNVRRTRQLGNWFDGYTKE